MGLRLQLALIGLVTLALPWAGCQYLRETEDALRQGQQRLLLDTAQSIATLLAERPALFPDAAAVPGATTLYAHEVRGMPVLDGYADDWVIPDGADPAAIGDRMALLVGRTAQHLHLFLDVDAAGDAADKRIEIDAGAPGTVYRFDPVAPGPLSPAIATRDAVGEDNGDREAYDDGSDGDGVTEQRIRAWWTPTTDGFNLEARIPRALVSDRLGVRVLQEQDGREVVIATTHTGAQPGRLAAPSPALRTLLGNYARPGLELTVTDGEGWRLADAGGLTLEGSTGSPTRATRLYRWLLADTVPPLPADPPTGRIDAPWVRDALGGEAGSVWRRLPEGGQAVVSAATPVRSNANVIGAVIMRESSAAILTLTNRALARLTTLTLIATLAVAAALLGYATWLSVRITRLSGAADRAMSASGRISAGLPSASAADELGDLSRSFSRLLARVEETNEYLRTLGARLSHELRTPLAVVTSSLDNLEGVGISPEQREYAARAREGSRRLQAILNAMSEASRTEQAVTAAEIERFDLAGVVESAAAGYATAYPERTFRLRRDTGSAPVAGAPELLVQMLDKLVANAVEFSETGAAVEIRLETGPREAVLSVANPGPPLPGHMREQIFDSLVSVRGSRAASHLGLGLYIARLIAEGHGGRIDARNLPDESGVVFVVSIPLAASAQSSEAR
jgi:two-component system sensor histidine kinase ChvG